MTPRTLAQRIADQLHCAADDVRMIAARQDHAGDHAASLGGAIDVIASLTLNLSQRQFPKEGLNGNGDSAPPHSLTWSRTFPGHPDQAGEARRFLALLLGPHPSADDAVACLGELCANAVQHSRSGLPGGTFHVRMCRSGASIRVEVTDQGGPWGGKPDGPEHGRGLFIVRALASRSDIILQGPARNPNRRTIWYEIAPP